MVKLDKRVRKALGFAESKRHGAVRIKKRNEVIGMLSALVRDDGYTIKTFIKEIKCMYPNVRIERRPTTLEERSGYLDWTNNKESPLNNKASTQAAAAMIEKKLVDWDVTDHDGNQVAISKANILKLHPDLFLRIRNIVCLCVDGGDEMPGGDDMDDDGADFLSTLGAPTQPLIDSQKNSESA